MLGVLPILVFQDKASLDTFLYLSVNLVCLLFRRGVGPATYFVPHELRLQLEVPLDQLVTGGWGA